MEKISLNSGERMILQAQGTLQCRASWRPGHLFLTNRRLFFIHVTKKLFEINLDKITGLSITKRRWLLGVRVQQLCIDCNNDIKTEQFYIALTEPRKWVAGIKESMTCMLVERRGYHGANPESPSNT